MGLSCVKECGSRVFVYLWGNCTGRDMKMSKYICLLCETHIIYISCFLTWRPILLHTVNHLSPRAASSPWCPKHTPATSPRWSTSSHLSPSLYHVRNTHTCLVPKWIGLNHKSKKRFNWTLQTFHIFFY